MLTNVRAWLVYHRMQMRVRAPLVTRLTVSTLMAVGVCATPTASTAAPNAAAPVAAPDAPRTAEKSWVAVVRLNFTGAVAEAARELFAARLVEGLRVADFQVTAGAPVAERLTGHGIDPTSCADEACYRRAGPALGVAYLVAGTIAERQKTYEIALDLVNARTGAIIGTHRERCEICGVEDAGEKMGLAASALRARLEALARTPARFVIRSHPSGAVVTLDGQVIGRTPLDRELPGGVHALQVSADGYDSTERTLTVVAGVDETLDLDLLPVASKFPFRAAGWTAVAVGVVALVGGIWAVAIDGNELACADGERDPWGHCPNVRNTRVLGAVLVGTGVAAGTLGGVWMYLGAGQAARPAEGAAPASPPPPTVAVGWRGTF